MNGSSFTMELSLGHDNGMHSWSADIYALRVYNRALTEAEVLQNATVDWAVYRGAALPTTEAAE